MVDIRVLLATNARLPRKGRARRPAAGKYLDSPPFVSLLPVRPSKSRWSVRSPATATSAPGGKVARLVVFERVPLFDSQNAKLDDRP